MKLLSRQEKHSDRNTRMVRTDQQDIRLKNDLLALHKRITFPGRMGALVSYSTSDSPYLCSLSLEVFNFNLMNHVFLQCILDISAQNILLSKSEYGAVFWGQEAFLDCLL